MMGRVGAKQSFEQGRGDLEELAGVVVQTKQVERISAQLGVQVEAFCQREREALLSGKVAPLLRVEESTSGCRCSLSVSAVSSFVPG